MQIVLDGQSLRKLQMNFLKHKEKIAILKILAWLASRDGDISKQEVDFLANIALQMGIEPLPSMKNLVSGAIDADNLHYLSSTKSKELLLKLLIRVSFVDGVYDSRERKGLMATALALGLTGSSVEHAEYQLTEDLKDQLSTTATPCLEDPDGLEAFGDQSWDVGKIAKIAGTSLAGGAAIALTGGLAAPVIGGAIGSAFFGLSGAAATSAGLAFLGGGSLAAGGAGMAGGMTLVSTVMGTCGTGIAGWKAKRRLDNIKEWGIQHIDGNGLHTCLGISGFLQQNYSHTDIWSDLADVFPKSNNYTLAWESKALHDVYNAAHSVCQQGIAGYMITAAAKSATKKAFGMAALPLSAMTALNVIDHPWAVAKNRADQAGKLLGDWIADDGFGCLPITLVGYSLGTRVIVAALEQLAQRNSEGKIYDIYFIGGAVARNDSRIRHLNKLVSGSVVNVYSKKDTVLAYMYRAVELLAQPIGINPLEIEGVVNIDVSETIGGHEQYIPNLKDILSEIKSRLGDHRATPATSQVRDAIIDKLIKKLDQVPGMTPANRADFHKSELYMKFQDGTQVRTWENIVAVSHVFIANPDGYCVYGGYVGWIHASGLKDALGKLRKEYKDDLV